MVGQILAALIKTLVFNKFEPNCLFNASTLPPAFSPLNGPVRGLHLFDAVFEALCVSVEGLWELLLATLERRKDWRKIPSVATQEGNTHHCATIPTVATQPLSVNLQSTRVSKDMS